MKPKMTAAVLMQTGKPLRIIENILIPELKSGQVLVKLKYSGVCHSQLMEAKGLRGKDVWLPHMLGHEGTGTVIEIGPNVSKINVSDKVVLGWIKGSGIEAGGTVYRGPDGLKINAGSVTTFSNYSVVSENRVVALPESTPMDLGILYGCALPTGAGIIYNVAEPHAESSIAIVGLGGIGISALMACKAVGVSNIFAIDVEEHKLRLAKELGAKVLINSSKADALTVIMNKTDGRGVDFSIEAAGSTKTIELAFSLVRESGGRCIFASHPPYNDRIKLNPFDLICGKKIEGSWGGASQPDNDIPRLGNAYKNGMLPLERLLSKPYSLANINDALRDLDDRKINRALIDMSMT